MPSLSWWRWREVTPDSDIVSSPRNRRVVEARRIRQRGTGRILIEGPRLVRAALDAGATPRRVFATREDDLTRRITAMGGDLVVVTDAVMGALGETQHPRGPVAIIDRPVPSPVQTRRAVVLWGVQDPGNVGALVRSAASFGFGVITCAESADPWGSKAVRASAGACFAVQLEHLSDLTLPDLRARGYTTMALVPLGGIPIRAARLQEPVALLVGAEGSGLPPDVVAAADVSVTIPTHGWDGSLNAAAAGSIAAYVVAENLRSAERPED